jgi:hypothetical protein
MLATLAPAAGPSWPRGPTNQRALPAAALAATAAPLIADAIACDDPIAALAEARRRAGRGGLVVVCGSMFLVGMLRAHVLGEPVDPVLDVGSRRAALTALADVDLVDARSSRRSRSARSTAG